MEDVQGKGPLREKAQRVSVLIGVFGTLLEVWAWKSKVGYDMNLTGVIQN